MFATDPRDYGGEIVTGVEVIVGEISVATATFFLRSYWFFCRGFVVLIFPRIYNMILSIEWFLCFPCQSRYVLRKWNGRSFHSIVGFLSRWMDKIFYILRIFSTFPTFNLKILQFLRILYNCRVQAKGIAIRSLKSRIQRISRNLLTLSLCLRNRSSTCN